METTTRKRSRGVFRLEEDKAAGGVMKPPEEEKKKKKLYAFCSHSWCSEYTQTLYALDIPSPGTIVEATTTTTTVTTTITTTTTVNGEVNTTNSTSSSSSSSIPERSPVEPVLRFSYRKWPRYMTCIHLGSKLYFLGGERGNKWKNKTLSFPTKVYTLDLSSELEIPSSKRDRPKKVLKKAPPMNTGKRSPVVSFVADGKIFVVSGIKHTGKRIPVVSSECGKKKKEELLLEQFEVFDPDKGKWEVAENQPPFADVCCLGFPSIVGRNVIFVVQDDKMAGLTYCYNLDSGTWSASCPPHIGFTFKNQDLWFGGEAVGKERNVFPPHPTTFWNVCPHPKNQVPLAVRLDISSTKKKKDKEKKKYFDVVKYYIKSTVGECGAMGVSSFLTRLGGDATPGLSSVRLCYLEVAYPDEEEGFHNLHLSVALFDVHGNGDVAEHVTSAHYVAKSTGVTHSITAAHAVSLSLSTFSSSCSLVSSYYKL